MKNKLKLSALLLSFSSISFGQIAQLDSTFHPKEKGFATPTALEYSINDIVYLPNKKILVGGWFNPSNGKETSQLKRLNSDGSIDSTFNLGGTGPNKYVTDILKLKSGKFLISGIFDTYNGEQTKRLVRINEDGSLDNTFHKINFGAYDQVKTLAELADGKLLIGGYLEGLNNNNGSNMLRLNSNGTIDNTFNVGNEGATIGAVNAINVQIDGKILVGGSFKKYNGKTANLLVRLNQDGTIDESFHFLPAIEENIRALAIQRDGKILVAGRLSNLPAFGEAAGVIRINKDGSLDSAFKIIFMDDMSHSNGHYVQKIQILENQKILIGGHFRKIEGSEMSHIALLNSDGTIDHSFDIGKKKGIFYVNDIEVQEDGKILFGGNLSAFQGDAGINRNLIARLASRTPALCYECITITSIEVKTETLNIYPNPTKNVLIIEIPKVELNSNHFVEVYNNMGQLAMSENLFDKQINVSALPEGLYYLKINVGNQILTKHFVKL